MNPLLNLIPKPQAGSTAASLHDGPRHVGIPPKVSADAVALSESEHRGDFLGINQVFGSDSRRHTLSLRRLTPG